MEVDPRIAALSYRELQIKCKDLGLPARGKSDVLRKTLDDYLKDPGETLKRIAKAKIKRRKNGDIDWKKSAAREILLEDLEPPNGWLYGLDELDARCVYDCYMEQHPDIFEDVPFTQFEKRYDEAIEKAAKRRARSAVEEEWLERDRILHPRQTHNKKGEPVFDVDEEAKAQLEEDIKNKLHKKMKPAQLWQKRDVYKKYKLSKFRPRIYQFERRVKFLNWLNKQRNEKRDEFAAEREPKELTFVPPVVERARPKIRSENGNKKRKRSAGGSKRTKRCKDRS